MANENGFGKPKLKAPPGTCDTHLHVYDPRYPTAKTAVTAPPVATWQDYRRLQEALGLERAVIVQPTAYGTDNRATLDAIAALGPERTRGIAVVSDQISEAELDALTRGGMRGARFQMVPGGAIPWEMLDTIAAKVQDFGWHVQLQLDGRTLPEREAQVMAWPGRIVIDHVGRFFEPVPVDHPGFRCLLRMLDSGRVWVKLSAPYESRSRSGPPHYEDIGVLASALARAAPERMLWASNWPHPGQTNLPEESVFLDLLLAWVPDEAVRRRILVDNPAPLYGF
jgi:D-galactarolactone isomerase